MVDICALDISKLLLLLLNLLTGKFVPFSADNIDILDEMMDGKNTVHATQILAWQRRAESNLCFRVNGENLSSNGRTKFSSVSGGSSKRMV